MITDEIEAERAKQIAKGWTPEHDDEHGAGELAAAAASYALNASAKAGGFAGYSAPPDAWPWDSGYWNPKEPRRDLIRAAALIFAEIERLDRATASST